MLETGGITETRHSSNGRISMYIDHCNWTKFKQFQQTRGIKESGSNQLSMNEASNLNSIFGNINLDQSCMSLLENSTFNPTAGSASTDGAGSEYGAQGSHD